MCAGFLSFLHAVLHTSVGVLKRSGVFFARPLQPFNHHCNVCPVPEYHEYLDQMKSRQILLFLTSKSPDLDITETFRFFPSHMENQSDKIKG